LIKDQQVQGMLGMLLVTWLVLGTWYWWTTQLHWLDALRHVAFNVTSVVTTTGFALGDYSLWGNFSLMLFFYLGFVGGCSGSTAGGIKIFRFQVAYILLKANLNQLIHPRAVIKQKYNGDLFVLLRHHHLRHRFAALTARRGLDDRPDWCGQYRVGCRAGAGSDHRAVG
jgi:trk system potassium uptake protein TrkH